MTALQTPPESKKAFSDIRDDYTFFERHSTESQAVTAALHPLILKALNSSTPIHLLDFGSGPGGFTEQLLKKLDLSPESLILTLVEPDLTYLEQAQLRLQKYSATPITASTRIETIAFSSADVIITNHVLYYVSNIESTLKELLFRLKPNGTLFATMASEDNALIKGWSHCFSVHSEAVPYFRLNDLIKILNKMGLRYEQYGLISEVTFVDTLEYRTSLLRFLTGTHYKNLLKKEEMLIFLDAYKVDGIIKMPLSDEILSIKNPQINSQHEIL